jgi:hypothetical protein
MHAHCSVGKQANQTSVGQVYMFTGKLTIPRNAEYVVFQEAGKALRPRMLPAIETAKLK